MNWHTTVKAHDADYEYTIQDSREHVGTYVLRISNGQTNHVEAKRNSFATVAAAQAAAETWAERAARRPATLGTMDGGDK